MKSNSSLIKLKFLLPMNFFWLLLLLPGTIMAGTTGKISGNIVDSQSKEVLIGANIVIKAQIVNGNEIPMDLPRGATSDLNGYYFILNIPPGQYTLQASYIGYKALIMRLVNVAVDRTTKVNFELASQALEGEQITVTAEREMVIQDRTSASAKVSGEDLKDLPVENFQEVLGLQAGVIRGLDGSLHIRGGRTSEVQYYVDGIAVSNPFNNNLATPVENNAIQELEVISGTFNAEYGQAMSGIVNIVTRDGTDRFTGSLSAYFGNFLSNHHDIFPNISEFNPFAQQYYETSFSGPLFWKFKFFASGRFVDQENWLFGQRIFMNYDSSNFSSPNPNDWYIEQSGDSAYVPMNPYRSLSGQIKLSCALSNALNFSYNLINNSNRGKDYSHYYKLNPDGVANYYTRSYDHLLKIVHVLSPRTFYNLNLAYYNNNYKSYVYENPLDERYRSIYRSGSPPQFIFSTGGLSSNHYNRQSYTYAGRLDLTTQANKANMVKLGAELRYHQLDYEWYAIEVDPKRYGNLEPRIPPLSSLSHDAYRRFPIEFSAYLQDKIEIQDLIMNVGLRFDYFNAQAKTPTDMQDPANKLFPRPSADAYRTVASKTQLSPRLGLAFPITVKGVIHASYGQFFQIPEFSRLYENPEFEVSGIFGSFLGNADLEPQRTDMYEIGLQQQLTGFMAVDITGFYRDVRNLLGAELFETYRGDILYGRYINQDYGAVRGITISTDIQLPALGFSAGLDYTYQVAKGIASDPKQIFFDAQGKAESQTILIPLNWDLRHTANLFVNYSQKSWGGSVITRLNSGYPFTPPDPSTQRQRAIIELRNSGRYKSDFFVDVRGYKRFTMNRFRFELFVKIENLLDSMRRDLFPEVDPRDAAAHKANGLERINTFYDYQLNPASQPTPREIKLGFKFDF